MTDYLEPGDKIKDTTILLTDGRKEKISQLMGTKGLVLYFYPKDDTPGCTTQACDFRDNQTPIKKIGYNVVGVSGDSIESHQEFTKKQKLNFPLIADTGHALATKLGVYGEKNLYGRIIEGIRRTTYIMDTQLKITKVYKNVRAKGHVERLLKDLQS